MLVKDRDLDFDLKLNFEQVLLWGTRDLYELKCCYQAAHTSRVAPNFKTVKLLEPTTEVFTNIKRVIINIIVNLGDILCSS